MAAAAGDPPAFSSPRMQLDLSRIRSALAPTLGTEEAPQSYPTEAAVALVLRGEEQPELLLIRRAERPDDPWSGHMALPGGRRAAADTTLVHTARREAFEEVGLPPSATGLIGRLPPLPAIALGRPVGMIVLPLVFQLVAPTELRVNHEVAEALWVSLADLRSGRHDTSVGYPFQGGGARRSARLPAWTIGGRIVWGLTHRMISNFFDLLDRQGSGA